MAKTRAQRKAERRRRQQQEQRDRQTSQGAADEEQAQEDTQRGVSGEVAEAEAVLRTGAHTEDYGEHVEQPTDAGGGSPVPGVLPAPVQPEPPSETETEAPAPSRADVGRPDDVATEAAPAEPRESRRDRRQREKEGRRKTRNKELQKGQAEKAEKRRGPILGFLLSCWAELKRVQWPDRDTLVQASAVTFIFVAVMAAYLGALDAAFNWFVKQLL
ncbi:MAG: preprotein translocase subunit SecE [Solirubrobacterales bacterium]|jgi:preprotein translocase SecE subunit|nr:preprotein translocase subunit SecE [Solirubrobacterales bacterium]